MSNPSPCKDELRQVFDRFDANGDGRISSEELAGVLNALGSTAAATSPSEIARVMKEVDADCDGFISLDEFAAFYAAGEAGADAPELRDAFEMYDQDKNGLISAAELHQILTRLGEKFSVDDCSRMIKSFDSDGDGNICFSEFQKMMAKPSDSAPPSNSK